MKNKVKTPADNMQTITASATKQNPCTLWGVVGGGDGTQKQTTVNDRTHSCEELGIIALVYKSSSS